MGFKGVFGKIVDNKIQYLIYQYIMMFIYTIFSLEESMFIDRILRKSSVYRFLSRGSV